MRNIRKYAVGLAATMALSVALVTPAVAATGTLQAPVHTAVAATIRPDTNIPLCGDHFQLTRHGSVVRIVGVDLGAFGSGAMRVILTRCSLCQIYLELRSAYMKDGLFPEMIELPHLINRNRPS